MFKKIRTLFFGHKKEQESAFIQFLEERLAFTPKDISLYKKAFQHKSRHLVDNYERLEFLGDSILDAVVCEKIYFKFPKENEGELSKIKSKLVSREALNDLALKLDLEQMYSYNDRLSITHFKNLGGNVLEALVGAIYLDAGYEKAKQFILNKLIAQHIDWDEVLQTKNFKTVLYAKSQKEKFTIAFEVLNENTESYEERFEIALLIDDKQAQQAKGPSKKVAEQRAAKLFLSQ